jgi:DNA/RNA-binding domain of Phe-tRNA-synthetase-like protein
MRDVANPAQHAGLDERTHQLETQLRSRFAGHSRAQLKEIATLQAYAAYYERFKKSYHVQLQLESVTLKGKSIPRPGVLVQAMFMAELQDMLLTAGHDLQSLQLPVTLNVATGDEHYVLLTGQEQPTKAGDMLMSDGLGVISSVLYGPDQRTRITPATQHVLFAVYAPAGIGEDEVRQHLLGIQANVSLVAPQASTELLAVYG